MGRAAYQSPGLLKRVDQDFYGMDTPEVSFNAIIAAMLDYAERHIAQAGGCIM